MSPDSRQESLAGRTAVVTGASRGIGLAVARTLAERGARLVMVARSEPALRAAAESVGGTAYACDVASADAVAGLAARVTGDLGSAPDILVNAAGYFDLAPIAQTSVEHFDGHIAINLRGPFLLIRAFLPQMLARRAGDVVSIGSVAGRVAFPSNGAYSASKFGLRGLHEVLAEEVRGTGVRATLLEPAATDTPLWDPLDPDGRPDLPSRSSMLRPEDVARAVAYVLSQPPGVEIPLLALRATR
jgi:NAD(P)-dependent dehydrogenase (short-subunit alcohol dehydrogenase family)